MIQRLALAAALLACATLPAAAAGGAGDASGAPDSRLEIALALYAGGVSLGNADMDASVRGGEYHVVSHLETSGVVNTFWKSQIQATSSGMLGDRSVVPALYDSFTVRRDGQKQQISLTYDDHAPKLFAEPVYSTTGYEVKPEDQKNTFDPLSAVMAIVSGANATPNNPCGTIEPVFDGRRRYNIEMNKVRDIDIKMDNGLYQGKGLLCQIHYKQIAGWKPTVLRDKDTYPVINAWMTSFRSGERTFIVPLKVWADTGYGTVVALTTSLKVDGAVPH
jgi:hypothetical protein